MSYKTCKAIALGSVATSVGIMHFDPDRPEDEDGRYVERILPEPDALKAEKKGLVEITGDADEADFNRQQAGFSARPAEVAADRLADLPDPESEIAATSTSATPAMRNFPAGTGRQDSAGDPDAAPVDSEPDTRPELLRNNVRDMKTKIDELTDSAEIDGLIKTEEDTKNRSTVTDMLKARKDALSSQ